MARLFSRIPLASLAVSLAAFQVVAQTTEQIRFARNAGIANDGRVAFTYQDDIWVVDADGSNPRRLTVNVARDFSPRWSPDGKFIAFTSNRTGNNDVFVIPATGGEPKQLTWYSGDDQALYWTPDGKGIVISTQRGANAWGSPLYVQPLDGSIAKPLGMGIARSGMISQDGGMIAFNRNLPSAWRKEYRGNAAATIALMNVSNGDIQEATNADLKQYKTFANNVFPMWGADGMVYFASERDGTFNLWRMSPKAGAGAAQQFTSLKSGGVFFPSISPDGRHIVFQHDFDLYTVDVPSGKPKKLNLTLAFDPKDFDVDVLSTQSRAEGFSVSPSGEYMAVDYHGEIMIVPTEQGVGERTQVTSSPWRERSESYSPDGRKIAYVSDEGGDQQVWLYDIATATHKKLSSTAGEKDNVVWAPNSQKLAYGNDNKIFEVDLSATGGSAREVTHNPAGGYTVSGYSADGNWLVYSRRDDEQNAEVYLFDIRAKKEYNVTQSAWNETTGQLTQDGKTLIFTSNRDGGQNQLFAVSLARLSEDPNDPLVRERNRRTAGGRGGRGSDSTSTSVGPTSIDMKGIDRRVTQLTRGTSGVGSYFLSRDGRTVYYAVGGGGFGGGGGRGGGRGAAGDNSQNGLYSVSIDGRDRRRIASGTFAGMQPTADRRTVYFRGQVRAPAGEDGPPNPPGRGGAGAEVGFPVERLAIGAGQPAGGGAGGGRAVQAGAAQNAAGAGEAVAFTFNVRVDRRDEWRQLLDESYRVMKYRYYDPQMHGKGLGGDLRAVSSAAQVRRHERGRLRHRQRNDRRIELVAHRRQRTVERQRSARVHDALPRPRAGARERPVSCDARLSRRPRRQGLDRHQQRRLRAIGRRKRCESGRRLLEDPEHDGQRVRPGQRSPRPRTARTPRPSASRRSRISPTSSTRSGSPTTATRWTRRPTARSPTSTSARWISRRSSASRTRSIASGRRRGSSSTSGTTAAATSTRNCSTSSSASHTSSGTTATAPARGDVVRVRRSSDRR
jgi:tricorn protease